MENFENKLVAVMNKSVEPGTAMNALAHLCLGLGGSLGKDPLHLMDYVDAQGGHYPNISKMPFIVLSANSNKIRQLIEEAKKQHLQWTAFTDTMTVGSWKDQEERTLQTSYETLIFYGIVLFGKKEIVTELTRKFSLWK